MQRPWLAFSQCAHLPGDLTHMRNALLLNFTGVRRRSKKVLLKEIPAHVPKGVNLKDDGRIVQLAFNCTMTSQETIRVITMAFTALIGEETTLRFLQASSDNTLDIYTQSKV